MSGKIGFRWVAFVNGRREDNPTAFGSRLTIHYSTPNLNLAQMTKMAKPRWFKQRQAVVKNGHHSIGIKDLVSPIQLVEDFEVEKYGSLFKLSDKGPSVQWLLDNKERINNPDPNKVLYVEDMAIRTVSSYYHDGNVFVEMVRVKDIEAFIDRIGSSYIEWLRGTFEKFLVGYGYTDTRMYRSLSTVLTVFQVSRKLGFKDPKEVAARLVSRRLVADLALKGVFESIGLFSIDFPHVYSRC